MISSQFQTLTAACANFAQLPATSAPSDSLIMAILLVLFLLCVAGLILGMGKLLWNPEARRIGSLLRVLLLLAAASLLLPLVVVKASRSRGAGPSPKPVAAVVAEPVAGGGPTVVPPGPSIAAASAALSESGSEKAEDNALSAVGRFLGSLNKAFAHALRSTFLVDAPLEAAPQRDPLSDLSASSAKRPAWIDAPPSTTADGYEVAVKAGPWKTPIECQQALDEEIATAVERYVARRIGEDAREQVTLPADYARRHLVKDQWLEKINTSLGEMYNLHALLAFDRQVEGKLRDAWNETVAAARLVLAAVVLGGAILLLSVIYGYLKIDLATGGAHRQRLRLATAGIVALVAAGAAYALR